MDIVPIEVREMFQMSMNLGDSIIGTVIHEFSCCIQHSTTKTYKAMQIEMTY